MKGDKNPLSDKPTLKRAEFKFEKRLGQGGYGVAELWIHKQTSVEQKH